MNAQPPHIPGGAEQLSRRSAESSAPEIFLGTVKRIWRHPENRNRRLHALARYLAWQLWERTVRKPWTVELLGPVRIRCYPHSPIASAVIYYGLADSSEMRFLLDHLETGDEFIDVGANVGVYSLLAATVADVRVIALEPSSLAHKRALENIALNRLDHRVTVLREAASSRPGSGHLTVDLDAMNSLAGESTGEVESVEVTTLDDLCRDHNLLRVAMVKVDVEGWETEVLQGAQALIRDQKPALIVEVNDPSGLESFRLRFGYQCFTYQPAQHSLHRADLTDLEGRNAILVHDPEAVLSDP